MKKFIFKDGKGQYGLNFNKVTSDSFFALADTSSTDESLGNLQVELDNHNHNGVYEPVFSKNTAFNKDFGAGAGQVAEGNDSRILNGQTAFDFGDHAEVGYFIKGTVLDENLDITGDIIPTEDNVYSLGTPEKAWRDLYVGPGSLYVNGKKVIEDVSETMNFTTSENQNLSIKTSGIGNLQLSALGTGDVELVSGNGRVQLKSNTDITGGLTVSKGANITEGLNVGENLVIGGNTTSDKFIVTGGGSPAHFLKSDGSVDTDTYSIVGHSHDYDKYDYWNLKTNGLQRLRIHSDDAVDFVEGTNIKITYGAGGVVTIDNTFEETTYDSMSLSELNTGTATTNKLVSAKTLTDWGDNNYSHIDHTHDHATLTPGTGINGSSFNGSVNRTFSINFGDGEGQVAEGNDERIEHGENAYQHKIISAAFTGDTNKTLTLTKENGNTVKATFLDADTHGDFADDVINTLDFNENNDGVLRAITSEGAIITTSLDGRYSLNGHTHNYDNYNGWDLLVDGSGANRITSGEDVDFRGGTNISLSRSGNVITVNNTLSYSAGSGITLSGTSFSHADTSSQASVNNSAGTVIQDVTLDGYGHVSGLVSYNLDNRYYTESESNNLFVNESGDNMTGPLGITPSSSGDILSVNNTSGSKVLHAHTNGTVTVNGELKVNSGVKTGLTSSTTIATVPMASNDAAHFDYVIKREGSVGLRTGTLMAVWDGNNVEYTDTSTADLGGSTNNISLSAEISGSNIILKANISSGTWTVKSGVRTL